MGFTWLGDTGRFVDANGAHPAHIVLEQTGDAVFAPVGSFTYHREQGTEISVDSTSLPETDLASIPQVMAWFVSRHGRHTPAALVHDQLVSHRRSPADRARADRVFLAALVDLDVPPVRSRLMWAAVTAATRWETTPWGRVGIIAWGLTALAGTALLVASVVVGAPVLALVALVAPSLAALLWSRREYAAGLIAGYALWVVVIPGAASFAGYAAYWLAEHVVRILRKTKPTNRGVELPGPIKLHGA